MNQSHPSAPQPAAAASSRPSRRRRRSPAAKLLMGLCAAFCILLAGEAVLRIVKTVRDDLRERRSEWHVFDPDLGWRPRPNYSGKVFKVDYQFDGRGLLAGDSPKAADASTTRIVVLGDSCTFGINVANGSAYPTLLDQLLPHARVINLGVPGYTSYQGYRRLLRDGLALHPDLLVVSFNFNDRRYVVPPGTVDGPEGFRRTWRADALRTLIQSVYLLRETSKLITGLAPAESPMPVQAPLEALQPRVSPEAYRRNLELIAAAARQRGIPVIFLLLGDNPEIMNPVRGAEPLIARGQFDEALARLLPFIDKDEFTAVLARKMAVEIYRRQGRTRQMRQAAIVRPLNISLHGGAPIYWDSDYGRIMREVAAAADSPCVDAAAALARHPEVYFDFCHFDRRGHELIAAMLRDAIKKIDRKDSMK